VRPVHQPLNSAFTEEAWRNPEREQRARARALARLDDLLEAERAAGAESFFERLWVEPLDANLPMVLVSQVQRSGGTLLCRLLDGHPELRVYPLELYWGAPTEYDWPSLSTAMSPTAAFRELAAGNAHQIERFTTGGYRKADRGGGGSPLTFAFSLGLQQQAFLRQLALRPANTRRDLLGAFMSSFFTAWLDYQFRYRKARYLAVFAKRHNLSPVTNEFFADYPDGQLVTVIRDPASWYASASIHSAEQYGDPEQAIGLWTTSVLASCAARQRWPEQVIVIGFERLIGDTDRLMRLLAERLGLPWNGRLTVPTFNGRRVLSNSSFAPAGGVDASAGDRGSQLDPAVARYIRQEAQPLYEETRSIWL
jgi:hypothetical protein